MEIKRWPAFLALTFSVSFRAFALAQELNDKPSAPGVNPKPIIGTIVVEEEKKTEVKPADQSTADQINRENGVELFSNDHPLPGGIIWGSSVVFPSLVNAENLPKFVIGVSLTEVPESLRAHIKLEEKAGIMIGALVPESPAAKAGLQQYDILLKSGDRDLKQPQDLQVIVDASEGKPISLTYQRRGEQTTIDVTAIKREDLQVAASENVDIDAKQMFHPWAGQPLPAFILNTLPPGFSPVPPQVGNLPQLEALTDSIRQLSEQVERLKGELDKLEKNQSGEGERRQDQ